MSRVIHTQIEHIHYLTLTLLVQSGEIYIYKAILRHKRKESTYYQTFLKSP